MTDFQTMFDTFIEDMPQDLIKKTKKALLNMEKTKRRAEKNGYCFYGKEIILSTEKENGIPPFVLSELLKSNRSTFSTSRILDGNLTYFDLKVQDISFMRELSPHGNWNDSITISVHYVPGINL